MSELRTEEEQKSIINKNPHDSGKAIDFVNKKVKEHLSFKMNENDDPNEIAVLYYAFGHLRQSLVYSLNHLVGVEKTSVEFYIKILDRWMADLDPIMKNVDVLNTPVLTR